MKRFGGDAACVGFPTVDGRGGHLLISGDTYAIAVVSAHKESGWDFNEDYFSPLQMESGLCGYYFLEILAWQSSVISLKHRYQN